MGTVTQYNLANVQAALGGANPISMSEYYRGGAYVPSTRNVTVREPTSGEYYGPTTYIWIAQTQKSGLVTYTLRWAGSVVATFNSAAGLTSYTVGSTTYYRGSDYAGGYYAIYRTYPSTTSINTGVPASGAISLSQLYGAQNP